MSKEECLKEIEYIKHQASIYGWSEKYTEEYERLKRIWEGFAHIGKDKKYIKAPEI